MFVNVLNTISLSALTEGAAVFRRFGFQGVLEKARGDAAGRRSPRMSANQVGLVWLGFVPCFPPPTRRSSSWIGANAPETDCLPKYLSTYPRVYTAVRLRRFFWVLGAV